MIKVIITLFVFVVSHVVHAEQHKHFSCDFTGSVLVNSSGTHEAKKWGSKGFTIQDDLVVLDHGNLKLKLTTHIDKFGTIILRGGDLQERYQFVLENGTFVYVMLMPSLLGSWTITGTCQKD